MPASLRALGATHAPPRPRGLPTQMLLGNGLTETRAYNNRLQVCRINTNTSLAALSNCNDPIPSGNFVDFATSYNYGAGDNGNIVNWTATGAQTFNRSYGYDGLNRLSTYSAPGDVCSGMAWVYDRYGNILQQNGLSGNCPIPQNPVDPSTNRLMGPSYAYDAAGNILADGAGLTYSYDAENHMLNNSNIWVYVNDAEGRRAQTISNGNWTVDYVCNLNNQILTHVGLGNGQLNGQNIFFGDQLIAEYADGTTNFAHTDHLNSVHLETWLDGTVRYSFDNLPFGDHGWDNGDLNDDWLGTEHKFAGMERDPTTLHDHALFREYADVIGRWNSPDPLSGHLEDPQTLNRYVYVRDNPLNLTDPTGLDFYLQCTDKDHLGCTQVQTDPGNEKSSQWVQADKNGNATIITSDSIRAGQNSATVSENGVVINGQNQGIYFENSANDASHWADGKDHNQIDLAGRGDFNGFKFHIDGNCSGTCLSSGTWSFSAVSYGSIGDLLNQRGASTIPLEDAVAFLGHGQHPYTTQYRFGGPSNSPHLSVPYDRPGTVILDPRANVPRLGPFHVDEHSDWRHAIDVLKRN
jgi:RHS repeat-associated protein